MITWKKIAAIFAFSVSTTPLGVACAAEASDLLDEEANATVDPSAEAETVDEASIAVLRPPVCQIICERRYHLCVNRNLYDGPPNPVADASVIRMCSRGRMLCLRSCRAY